MSGEPLARRIVQHLQQYGFKAFFVGGCVRDLQLHRPPSDWDVATSATPVDILRLFPHAHRVGAHFGVILVSEEDAQVEVATFRSDGVYSDGRRPLQVHFETDPREDALRRDFTINTLFLDPETDQLLDFTGGREDLDAKLIRAIGNPRERFAEDHLRLLRAIRFAARLGFEIEPATWVAIQDAAPLIASVSAERIRDELTRILTEGHARRGFELLDTSGLLPVLLPEISVMKGVEQPPQYHPEGDVWTHTLLLLEGLDTCSATLAWGALLHDVGKPPTFRIADRIRFDGHVEAGVLLAREILNRLRFSNTEGTRIEALIKNHMRFKDALNMRPSTLKRFLRMPAFDEHLELHRLDCLACHGNLEAYNFAQRKLAENPPERLAPQPLLSGRDLIDAGYSPGPAFSRIIRALEDAQLDGTIYTREDAIAFLTTHFPQER